MYTSARLNIVMFTNTFTPHVGGVARSVEGFAQQYRKLGHRVLIVAPEFEHTPSDEIDVLRVPALQKFNGSDFSVALPVSGLLSRKLDEFQPHIIHAHHPFLLGMTAMRIARYRNLPLVFTQHTLYEKYTHYVPGDSPKMQQFSIELATHYANLADRVFAPSESVATLLRQRGVNSKINVVPTGVKISQFENGNGERFRKAMNIPKKAFVVGHLGRLAAEKNLPFLSETVAQFIASSTLKNAFKNTANNPKGKKHSREVHFLLIGKGPSENHIRTTFQRAGITKRLHVAGILNPRQLADAYDAMDVFAFASKSETQGMVLTEAMACGVPVVALDASGVKEVVIDTINGRLLQRENAAAFAAGLKWVADQPPLRRLSLSLAARKTAREFSMSNTANLALQHYQDLCHQRSPEQTKNYRHLTQLLELIKIEWAIIEGFANAASHSIVTNHTRQEEAAGS